MTLRTRLTAAFLVVVLVPLLVGAALALGRLPAAAQRLQGSGMATGAGTAVAAIAERCSRLEAAATAAGQALAGGTGLSQALQKLVDERLLDGVRVVDAGGREVGVAGVAPAVPAPDCRTGAVSRSGDGAALTLTLSVRRPGAADLGRVSAALRLDRAYAQELGGAAGVQGLVLLADGEPVAGTVEVDADVVGAARRAGGEAVRRDGMLFVVVQAPDQPVTALPGEPPVAVAPGERPLAVLVTQRPSWRPPVPAVLLVPGLVAVAALFAVLIGSGLARATTQPLEELGRAATRVAGGDLTTTIAVRSRDEVGQLATAFNSMTKDLREHVDELRASRDQLRGGVDRLGNALAGTHDLRRILEVVLDTATSSTRARAGAVLLRDAASGDLVLSVGRNLAELGVPDDLRLPLGTGIGGGVARSGTPVRGRTGPGGLVPGRGEPAGVATAALPLSSSDTVVGVLLLWDREGGADFTEADLAMLQTFTTQATVAVDNVLLHDEARRLSVTDGLTGLTNFRGFTMTVGKEIERAVRFGRPLGLLLLDLDHFKLVNDVWGHQRGDAVLVELATRVRGQVRDVDTLARYGGEEFVVVLPETDVHGAQQAAERITAAVRRRPFGEAGEQPIDITVSIGVAVFPDHGTSSTTLLRRADEALYGAKDSGRDGWRLATPESAPDAGARPS